jgi:two-component system nitrate/nitrite response regulator NarL
MASILLVDDHRSVLWGLSRLIESAGPPLKLAATASTAAEAMAVATAQRPDVVLLDLDLGGEVGDGARLVAPLRALGSRVLILTGSGDQQLQDRAVMEGASGLVHKSEPAEQILRAIAQVCAGDLWLERASLARVFSAFCSGQKAGPAAALRTLTPAERKVISVMVRHKSKPNKVIAAALGISAHTLRNHLASIYDKLALNRRLDLVLYAIEHKLDRDPLPPS